MDKIRIRRRWKQITYSKSQFTNRLEKTLKIWSIERTEYGHIIKIELPYSYTLIDLESNLDIFKEGLGYKSIQLKNESNIVYMYCVKQFKFKDFSPIRLPANKLLIADGLTKPIIVDMNKFPHMLVGGDTGTGKSRILLLILSNLINWCNNIDIYLLQVRKNDLGVFQNCKQVVVNSKTLQEVLESLIKIDKECSRRERLIDNTKGYYNIEDYNKKAYNKLKYIYVVIEEFSFLNISKGDTKQEKQLKAQCLKHIKTIVNVGRSSGVFLITALQKPTNDSIPSDIKAQLCTRISLKIADEPAAVVVLGNGKASKLQEREVICRTLDEQRGYSFTIDHDMITETIKNRIIEKKKEVAPFKDGNDISSILSILNEIAR
ncbi:FtsK/SpoIIIE domain-containing protein [Clostridium sp. OS1-26]|uniref:FtsK/SpoIIIE domain-containing protein n=1 Tax=Clostridium sp. OS1-26 TaxID=3070681 RepID=UPI0027E0A2CF|nr:FtsK/SpoIIIE domain-containing protein [Clostridium sp. OS1-26]WML35646.1 FtsK/SpoIIIE domain-containing protein [Clostridium sp. OS1-26]